MDTYKIEAAVNNFFIPGRCVLCGNGYEPRGVRYTLHIDGLREGEVCDICARGTPEIVAARARACANEHIEASQELMNKAEIVLQEFSADVFPTPERIALVEQEARNIFAVEPSEELLKRAQDALSHVERLERENYTEQKIIEFLGAKLDTLPIEPPPQNFPPEWDDPF